MAEYNTLVDNKQVTYSGLFRLDELYAMTRRFFREHDYWMVEKKNQEDIFESGKQILIELEPTFRFNDYAKSKIRVLFEIHDLKDKIVTIDGQKQKYQHGAVRITFYAYLESDYRNRWESTGMLFFIRTMMNKFVRKDVTHEFMDRIIKDTYDCAEELKAYLNMSRFKVQHSNTEHREKA